MTSKALVVVWAILLCLMAHAAELARQRYGDILNLALAMATYTGGAMLAAFMLALLRLNVDYRGILWAAPLSVLTVFAISWHPPWAQWTTAIVATLILGGWVVALLARRDAGSRAWRSDAARTVFVFAGAMLAVFLCKHQSPVTGDHITVAWPWNVPIGFAVAFALGWLLARRRNPDT